MRGKNWRQILPAPAIRAAPLARHFDRPTQKFQQRQRLGEFAALARLSQYRARVRHIGEQ
jgi:hypothetical protein